MRTVDFSNCGKRLLLNTAAPATNGIVGFVPLGAFQIVAPAEEFVSICPSVPDVAEMASAGGVGGALFS